MSETTNNVIAKCQNKKKVLLCKLSYEFCLHFTPKISPLQKTHRWKSNMPSTKCQKLKHFCKKILMNNLTLSNVGNRCRIVHDVKPGCLLTWRPLETLMRKSQNWQSSCVRAAPFTHLLLRRLPSTAASRRRARGARSTSSPAGAAERRRNGGGSSNQRLAVLPSHMRRRTTVT